MLGAFESSVTVRLETPDEHEPVVVAEVDGEPVAALGLREGEVVSGPGRVNASIVTLLHLHRLEARLIMSVFGA
jgi:hypothetical protein